jgi:hypothetical protein
VALRGAVRAVLLWCLCALPAFAATITRGPFLQLADASGVTVVFKTDVPAIGTVRCFDVTPVVYRQVGDTVPTTTHVLRLANLTPSTQFHYEVLIDGVLAVGGPEFRFKTYPPPGVSAPFRLFAWGDSGLGNVAQLSLAERLSAEVGEATLSLILGDIIYWGGEPELYDDRYFAPYAPLLRRSVVWPTIGNHDVGVDPSGGPYLDAFVLPTNNPANTELYYSFDYGDAHFVCLDTHVSGHGPGSAQLQWAAADLAASTAKWKFVFFHVPPYSGGTHADDALVRSGIVPLVEAAGVDVVFSGHSHVYERSYLLQDHAVVQASPAVYEKPRPDAGTLYIVSGTAGQSGGLSNPAHPLMAFQVGNVLGASVIDVSGDTLRGFFLEPDGGTVDLFRLSKGPDGTPPRLLRARFEAPGTVLVSFDEPLRRPMPAEKIELWRDSTVLTPRSVELLDDQRTLKLDFGPLQPGEPLLRIGTVTDTAGNPARDYALTVRLDRVESPLARNLEGGVAFFATSAPVPAEWMQPGFDTTGWRGGLQPIGAPANNVVTPVEPDAGATLYLRASFRPMQAPETYRSVQLDLDYSDGFVAFLNGVEVARQNVRQGQDVTTRASMTRSPGLVEHRLVPRQLLRAGDNVLAVEVHPAGGLVPPLFLDVGLELVRANPADDEVPDAGAPAPARDGGVPGGGGDVRVGGGGCSCGAPGGLAVVRARAGRGPTPPVMARPWRLERRGTLMVEALEGSCTAPASLVRRAPSRPAASRLSGSSASARTAAHRCPCRATPRGLWGRAAGGPPAAPG